jgi:Arc/MetJ family transcription regulator
MPMRTTVELDEKLLQDAMSATGTKKGHKRER